MHLSMCCPPLPILGNIGGIVHAWGFDIDQCQGVRSCIHLYGAPRMYKGFDSQIPHPWRKSCIKSPDKSPVQPSRGRVGQHIDRCTLIAERLLYYFSVCVSFWPCCDHTREECVLHMPTGLSGQYTAAEYLVVAQWISSGEL